MPDTTAPEITGLTVRYGDTVAVDDLDLHVPTGQTVALLGANGAGKSTIVNAVLGLFRPAAGTVRVLGGTPRVAVRAGCVGAMLQHGGLPSEARVGEVLMLVRRSFPAPWPMSDLVVTPGIDGLLDRPVEALSGASGSASCSPWRWPRCATPSAATARSASRRRSPRPVRRSPPQASPSARRRRSTRCRHRSTPCSAGW